MRRRLAALVVAALLPMPAMAGDVVVRSGETLSDIAARHGVPLSRLMQLNGIKDPDLVIVGTRLVLPGGGKASGGGRRPSSSPGQSHVVQPGETLSEIADRYGLSTSRLMQLNGISNANLVEAGTRLKLRATPAPAAVSTPSRRSTTLADGATSRYTVREGETLSEIADRLGLTTSRLMQLNGISDANLVFAGSQLLVPAPKTAARSTSPEASRATYNRQASSHVVRPGETLSDLSEGYKVPIERLIALNNLQDPDHLVSGTRLKLRTTAAKPPAARVNAINPSGGNTKAVKAASSKPPTAKPPTAQRPTAKPPVVASQPPRPATKAVTAAPAPAQLQAAGTSQPTPASATEPSTPREAAPPVAAAAASPQPEAAAVAQAESRAPSVSLSNMRPPASEAPIPAQTPVPMAQAPAGAIPVNPDPKPPAGAASFTPASAVALAPRQPAVQPSRQPITQPEPKPAAMAQPEPAAQASISARPNSPIQPQATEAPKKPVRTALRSTTASATSSAAASQPAPSDWRTYGPLQIDWANWYAMGGSFVAPSLNRDGQPLYLAVNCKARKLNATSQAGQWNTWDAPQTDFEQQLVNDICRQKGI